MGKKLDHTGVRYGRLVGIKYVSTTPSRQSIWLFQCDCGNTTEVMASAAKFGSTLSCGCLKMDRIKEVNTKHGLHGTKEYRAWKQINIRCCNKNRKDWHRYGGIGLTSDFRYDFQAFLDEIGKAPEDGCWSVDRIDPTKGYVKGNIRWATIEQQAKNKRMQGNNTSGKTGVGWKQNSNTLYAFAYWKENGKTNSKYFSVKAHGIMEAFCMACKYREEMISKLTANGESYTEFHGKDGGL